MAHGKKFFSFYSTVQIHLHLRYGSFVLFQKVEAAMECERRRCEDLLAEQKKKTLTSLKKSPDSSQSKPKPRYDLNELRHHQRRCAALLFGARERGAHKLPVLVGLT